MRIETSGAHHIKQGGSYVILDKLKEHNMSRTYKDNPTRVRFPEPFDHDRVCIPGTWHSIELPTTRAKKRKREDTEHHWMGTPSWWTHMMMIRPRRARENQSLRCMGDVNEFDFVDTGRKPHIYYW